MLQCMRNAIRLIPLSGIGTCMSIKNCRRIQCPLVKFYQDFLNRVWKNSTIRHLFTSQYTKCISSVTLPPPSAYLLTMLGALSGLGILCVSEVTLSAHMNPSQTVPTFRPAWLWGHTQRSHESLTNCTYLSAMLGALSGLGILGICVSEVTLRARMNPSQTVPTFPPCGELFPALASCVSRRSRSELSYKLYLPFGHAWSPFSGLGILGICVSEVTLKARMNPSLDWLEALKYSSCNRQYFTVPIFLLTW